MDRVVDNIGNVRGGTGIEINRNLDLLVVMKGTAIRLCINGVITLDNIDAVIDGDCPHMQSLKATPIEKILKGLTGVSLNYNIVVDVTVFRVHLDSIGLGINN